MKNIQNFLEKFKEQYIDGDEIQLNPDSYFKEIGTWDSLTGMSIIVMIKDEFNIDFPLSKFKECKTVQEVYNEIIKIKI